MTIELSPEIENLIQQQVNAGHFPTPTAAVNAAGEFMLGEGQKEKHADLIAMIDEGIADLEAGRVIEDFNLQDFLAERRRVRAATNVT